MNLPFTYFIPSICQSFQRYIIKISMNLLTHLNLKEVLSKEKNDYKFSIFRILLSVLKASI